MSTYPIIFSHSTLNQPFRYTTTIDDIREIPGAELSCEINSKYKTWIIPITADRTFDLRRIQQKPIKPNTPKGSPANRRYKISLLKYNKAINSIVRLIINYKIVYFINPPHYYSSIFQDVYDESSGYLRSANNE